METTYVTGDCDGFEVPTGATSELIQISQYRADDDRGIAVRLPAVSNVASGTHPTTCVVSVRGNTLETEEQRPQFGLLPLSSAECLF
jgi:hypothetical protein